MEDIKEAFNRGIEETEKNLNLVLEQKSKILRDIRRLNKELSRKKRAKSIYFGEKLKNFKKEKSETKQGEVKNNGN